MKSSHDNPITALRKYLIQATTATNHLDGDQLEKAYVRRCEDTNCTSLEDYLSLIQADSQELGLFVSELADDTTWFYRNPLTWQALESRLKLEIIPNTTFTAWSAGCSDGSEAYSLAFACQSLVDSKVVNIIGTDMCQQRIDQAWLATYKHEALRDLPEEYTHYFAQTSKGMQVPVHIQEICTFECRNIFQHSGTSYDVVACNCVAEYCSEQAHQELAQLLVNRTRPGGYILTDAFLKYGKPPGVKLISMTLYQRIS